MTKGDTTQKLTELTILGNFLLHLRKDHFIQMDLQT